MDSTDYRAWQSYAENLEAELKWHKSIKENEQKIKELEAELSARRVTALEGEAQLQKLKEAIIKQLVKPVI